MIRLVGFVISLCLLVSGCSHSSVTKDVVTPDFLVGKESKQITFFGDNDHPRFSFDGTRLLYQSYRTPQHKGLQIYEMDLLTNKERRITFSDGDAFDATYISANELLYASTTDEIKENPLTVTEQPAELPPADLYMSDLFGTDILRLTRQPGYDGQALFYNDPKKPFIIFASRRGDLSGVYRLDLQNLPVSLISAEKDKAKVFPAISTLGKSIAWVEKDLKTQKQSIVLLKNRVSSVLKKEDGEYRDLFFAPRPPERLFYSVLRKGEKRSQIEVFDIARQCTQVVFKGSDNLSSPAISNDSVERIAFVRSFQDRKQIYMVNLPTDLGPCLEPPAQATLKE